MQVTRHDSRRVTPFGHPGITARLTAPPGLSRPPTSFIGPWYQGIHRPPLPTYPHTQHIPTDEPQTPRCSRPLCKSQPTTNPPPPTTHPDSPRSCLAPRQQPHPTSRRDHEPAGPHPDRRQPAPTTGAEHHHARGTVVPSEPQQGARRRPDPDRPARSAPAHTPRPPRPNQGNRTDARGRTRPTRPTPDPTSQCLRPPSHPPPHPRATGVLNPGGLPPGR